MTIEEGLDEKDIEIGCITYWEIIIEKPDSANKKKLWRERLVKFI